MSQLFNPLYLIPSLVLLISVASDLYRKKIFNKLIITFAVLSIANHFIFLDGISSLKFGLLAAVIALCFTIPMFIAKMLGGGDVKLLVVLALNIKVASLINTFVYSLFWGLLLGIVTIVVKKQSKSFIANTVDIVSMKKPNSENFHTIPYSVALFFGWLTNLTLGGFGLF